MLNLPESSQVSFGGMPNPASGHPFTLEKWLRMPPGSSSGEQELLAFESEASDGCHRLALVRRSGGAIVLRSAGRPDTHVAVDDAAPHEWVHRALVFDSSSVSVYINGRPQAPVLLPALAGADLSRWAIRAEDGKRQLRELRAWSTARTEEQIVGGMLTTPHPQPDLAALFDFGTYSPDDLSGNGHELTVMGDFDYLVETRALHVAGGASADCGDEPEFGFVPGSPFSVEAWIRPSSLRDPAVILTKGGTAETGRYKLELKRSGRVRFVVGVGVGVVSPALVAATEWHHVAGVCDGSHASLYIDGELAGAPQPVTYVDDRSGLPETSRLVVGASSNGDRGLDGLIEEVRVWREARTAEQIRHDIERHPILDPGLVAYFGFDFDPLADAVAGRAVKLVGEAKLMTADRSLPVPGGSGRSMPVTSASDLASGLSDGSRARLAERLRDREWGRKPMDRSPQCVPEAPPPEHMAYSLCIRSEGDRHLLDQVDPTGSRQELFDSLRDGVSGETLWRIQVMEASVGVLLAPFGIPMMGGASSVRLYDLLMSNSKVAGSFDELVEKRSPELGDVIRLLSVVHDAGMLQTVIWSAVVGATFWQVMMLMMHWAGIASGTGWPVLAAVVAASLAYLAYVVSTRPIPGGPAQRYLEIGVFQAGHGDCILLRARTQLEAGDVVERQVLVDGGPGTSYRRNVNAIPSSLDAVAVTHVDRDHIGGILALFRDVVAGQKNVGELWFNAPPPQTLAALTRLPEVVSALDGTIDEARLAVALAPSEIARLPAEVAWKIETVQDGRTLQGLANQSGVPMVSISSQTPASELGELPLSFFGPTPLNWNKFVAWIQGQFPGPQSRMVNRASIMFRVSDPLNGFQLLMTGDGWDVESQDRDLNNNPVPGKTRTDIRGGAANSEHVTILKVPHHGSRLSCDDNFYAHVTADYYIVSGADHATSFLPSYDALRWLVEGAHAAGANDFSIYVTNESDGVTQLAHDPDVGPHRIGYKLFCLKPGLLRMTFLVQNGVVIPPGSGTVDRLPRT